MALPHANISQIPVTPAPDAAPGLWNDRYDEIDDNFVNHEGRLNTLDSQLGIAAEVTIQNRGVIYGCTLDKSTTAARNLHLRIGEIFIGGQRYDISEQMDNAAAVPSNPGASAETCYAYAFIDANGDVQCDCTALGGSVPANGLYLAVISVPANNTEANDPNLTNVTINGNSRREDNWPASVDDPASHHVTLALSTADYLVVIEPITPNVQAHQFVIDNRAGSGFDILFAGTEDDVTFRYLVKYYGA